MDTLQAFMMGEANRNREEMVFDWDKAAKLIIKNNAVCAAAGLRDDWENTGGIIFLSGKPFMHDYTYLSSTWAIPEIKINNELYECYKMAHEVPNWNAKTKWPVSALRILRGD